ncbi:outer membrane protein transport protein [Paludibacter sp.]
MHLSVAQNNTNSPYTRFGYGEIVDVNSGEQRAMGGVAFGLRNGNSINPANPASYSTVDSTTFMFDVGFTGLFSNFVAPNGRKSSFNSNLEYVNLQFPITKWLGFSAGMLPYSFSGYNFYDTDSVQIPGNSSTPTYTNYTRGYSGSGGVSQIYSGLGLKFLKNFSLGVNAYYMFGDVNNTRTLSFANENMSSSQSIQDNEISIKSFRFRYGLQYFQNINKKHDLTVGVVYENRSPLNGNFIQYNIAIPTDTITYNKAFETPTVLGAGINYTFNNQLSVSADYMLQQWGKALFFGATDSLHNRTKIAIGAEYISNPRGNKYTDRIKYRFGLNLHNPYYEVAGNNSMNNFGISFGIGLPLKTSNTMINAAVEYGKVGNKSILREDYFKLTFNATFNENWFFKRKL